MRLIPRIMAQTGLFLFAVFAMKVHSEPLLNGLAIHSELGQEQFIAGLFSSTLSSDANTILLNTGEKRIQVRILNRRISSRSFKRMWIEGIAINASPKELEEQAQNMATFSNMLKVKLEQGDIFTIDRSLDDVIVSLNGAKLGIINDAKFFDLLLRTWIGPVPLSSDFRESLLTNGKLNPELQSRFNSTAPSNERITAIAGYAAGTAAVAASTGIDAAAAAADVAKPDIDVAPPTTNAADLKVADVTPPKINAEAVKPPLAAETTIAAATPKPVATPTKAPQKAPPKQVAAAPVKSLLDESLLEDEEEDIEFTAAGVLAQTLYISKLKRWTNQFIKYPSRALERGWEGNVRLKVTIARDGSVQEVIVTEPGPYKDLTKAAEKAVKKADPFPAMPPDLTGKTFQFALPVVFVLR